MPLSLTEIGDLVVGKSSAKVMGIINASPESFFKGSVRTTEDQISFTARQMEQDGAHIIDIGAMSTAPYLKTMISEDQEIQRMTAAVKIVKAACNLPISADTPRAKVAEAAIEAGVDIINDVTGLRYDKEMADFISKSGVKVIVCAYSKTRISGHISGTIKALKESLLIASKSGISGDDIIIDPSIGFFRSGGENPFYSKMVDMPWYSRDMQVISQLHKLRALKKPVCVSVSRKSFIGHLLNLELPEDRMAPSIACELISATNGANLIRTHNVKETVQALTMLELLGTKNTQRL
jgi:dihydropteroate synthase